MPVFTSFTFKGAGTDPEDAQQTATLDQSDPLVPKLQVGASTKIALVLEDEYGAALTRVAAEDVTDGVDPEGLTLGRGTPEAFSLGVVFDDTDPADVKRYIVPHNQATPWSESKAADFHAGMQVVRTGLGV